MRDYKLARQQNPQPEHSSVLLPEQCVPSSPRGTGGHLWFLLPLALSLGTGESLVFTLL